MTDTTQIWITAIQTIGLIIVNIVMIWPNLRKNRNELKNSSAETKAQLEQMAKETNAKIDNLKADFLKYKSSDDDRYAQAVRVRILHFDDNLVDDGRKYPSDSSFKQALQDCDTYENYIKTHPNFINGIGEDAIDSIRSKYRYVKDNRLFGMSKR